MPTIHDTWDQLDQESIKLAWKKQVNHKGFELAWRVEESRLAREAKKKLGYVPKWLGGPGPSPEVKQRLRERRWEQNTTMDLTTARPEVLQELVSDSEEPHVFKWIDALFQTWRDQRTNWRETPEFLWAILYKGVADEVRLRKREALLSSGSLFVRACKYLESVRDRVELEVHKLQHAQFREEAPAARPVGQGNTRKPRNVHHDPLKAHIGAIKRNHPGISHRKLCLRLDKMPGPVGFPRGSTWHKKSGERSWIGNYDCHAVRPLMDTYFSKIPPASTKWKSTK